MLTATTSLVKHSAVTSAALLQFASCVADMDVAEAKAVALFHPGSSRGGAGGAGAGAEEPGGDAGGGGDAQAGAGGGAAGEGAAGAGAFGAGAFGAAGAGWGSGGRGIQWGAATRLLAWASGPPRAQADAVSVAFQEPLEAAAALCQVWRCRLTL